MSPSASLILLATVPVTVIQESNGTNRLGLYTWLHKLASHDDALVVEKVPDVENALVDPEQTVCTWNSYDVTAVSPEMAFVVVVDVVEVHNVVPVGRY